MVTRLSALLRRMFRRSDRADRQGCAAELDRPQPRWQRTRLAWKVATGAVAPVVCCPSARCAGSVRSCQPPSKCPGWALCDGSDLPECDIVLRMTSAIEVRPFRSGDLPHVVEFSLRAWEPVYASLRKVLGDDIFFRLHPDWKADQAAAVSSSCTSPERDTFVAVLDAHPVGFAAVALNAFHERMGAIDIIATDPHYQRRGVAKTLTAAALDHMRNSGMDIAVVETGGDAGHAPARETYAATGFTLLPIARYFQLIQQRPVG